jgi:hypothetical protein
MGDGADSDNQDLAEQPVEKLYRRLIPLLPEEARVPRC